MQDLALTDTNRVAPSIWSDLPATSFRIGYDGVNTKLEAILDFSDDDKPSDLALHIFTVPKGSVIIGVGYEIVTPCATSITANIGQFSVDSAGDLDTAIDVDEYVANGAMDAAAKTVAWNPASGPIYGCAADIGINFTLSAADVVGVVRVFAVVMQP